MKFAIMITAIIILVILYSEEYTVLFKMIKLIIANIIVIIVEKHPIPK